MLSRRVRLPHLPPEVSQEGIVAALQAEQRSILWTLEKKPGSLLNEKRWDRLDEISIALSKHALCPAG